MIQPDDWDDLTFEYLAFSSKEYCMRGRMKYTVTYENGRREILFQLNIGAERAHLIRLGFQYSNIPVKDRIWEAIADADKWEEIIEDLKINRIHVDRRLECEGQATHQVHRH